MRKINSDFKTAFLSEAGSELLNNDYFAFVELDEYACYVIADGLNLYDNGADAKLAIQTVIQKFEENPSTKKHMLRHYLEQANHKLLKSGNKRQGMKASITVVVSDYESIRYAVAGNTRCYLYRGDEAYIRSADTSLAEQMRQMEDSARDKLALHLERNNLYTYLGQRKGFEPYVSKKIKLQESDVIALFSRGIWENLDDGELLDVFCEASNHPQDTIDIIEELVLAKQKRNLENYTMVGIFVNKVFCDPHRQKKRKKRILIAVIILIVLIGLSIFLFLWNRNQKQKRASMEEYFSTAMLHIGNSNFTRAEEPADEALSLSKKLNDKNATADIDAHLQLIQTILTADERLRSGDYQGAREMYLTAQDHSRIVGNAAEDYITRQLELTEQYSSFHETMLLGDSLANSQNYTMALSMYQDAKRLAASLHFFEGRTQAVDAISLIYERMADQDQQTAAQEAEQQETIQQNVEKTLSIADLIVQGDQASASGDFKTALSYYKIAKERNTILSDESMASIIDLKIDLTNRRIREQENQKDLAESYENKGDEHYDQQAYAQAKRYYTLARQLFEQLSLQDRVRQIDDKLVQTELALEEQRRNPASRDEGT